MSKEKLPVTNAIRVLREHGVACAFAPHKLQRNAIAPARAGRTRCQSREASEAIGRRF